MGPVLKGAHGPMNGLRNGINNAQTVVIEPVIPLWKQFNSIYKIKIKIKTKLTSEFRVGVLLWILDRLQTNTLFQIFKFYGFYRIYFIFNFIFIFIFNLF